MREIENTQYLNRLKEESIEWKKESVKNDRICLAASIAIAGTGLIVVGAGAGIALSGHPEVGAMVAAIGLTFAVPSSIQAKGDFELYEGSVRRLQSSDRQDAIDTAQ